MSTETTSEPAELGGDGISVQRDGPLAIVVLSNPGRRNAFHPDMRRALEATVRGLEADAEVRAMIVTGEGGDFCAGADVSRIPSGSQARTPHEVRENMREVHQLVRTLTGCGKPLVAAVEGACAGAGMSIALACDVIVAAEDAKFATAFTRLGLLPDMGMLHLLPRRVGVPAARRMMLTSVRLSGRDAAGQGLVDELVERGQALGTAREVANELAAGAPIALEAVKQALAAGAVDLEDALRMELEWVPVLTATSDHREALAAFRDKRDPKFTGS